jgi:hypothetical protein
MLVVAVAVVVVVALSMEDRGAMVWFPEVTMMEEEEGVIVVVVVDDIILLPPILHLIRSSSNIHNNNLITHHRSHHPHYHDDGTVTAVRRDANPPHKVSSPLVALVSLPPPLLEQVPAPVVVGVKANCNPPRQDYYGI